MRAIPDASRHQFGVFTRQQAASQGWTSASIATAISRGTLIRLRPGLFIDATAMAGTDPSARRRQLRAHAAAAALAHPGAVVSHRSAALIGRLPVLAVPQLPCLTLPPRGHATARDIHMHRAPVEPHDVVFSARIARTSSARTVIDIARECGLDEATVVADAALRKGMTDRESLAAAHDRCRRWPGARRITDVLARCDGRAESPLESISRLRFLEIGLPVPRLQARIIVDGVQIARTDFLWPDFGVVGEADGLEKYDGSRFALRDEKRRQEALERSGLIVVRWGWADVDSPHACAQLAERLRWAFGRAASNPASPASWRAV